MQNRFSRISKLDVFKNRGILLYHGSKAGLLGDLQPHSRNYCDFGSGLYLGTVKEQAYSVCIHHENPHFYQCMLDLSGLSIKILEGIQWTFFVGMCRGSLDQFDGCVLLSSMKEFESSADILIGDIADDSIYPAFDDFVEGRLTDIGLRVALSTMKLGQQYVVKSIKGCNNISLEEINLSLEEVSKLHSYEVERSERSRNILREVSRVYRSIGSTIDDYYDRGVFDETFESLREIPL